jgi:hypothetical protein
LALVPLAAGQRASCLGETSYSVLSMGTRGSLG